MSKQTMAKLPLFFIMTVFFFILNVVAPVFQSAQGGLIGKISHSMQSTVFAETDGYGYCYNAGFTALEAENCADINYEQVVCLVEGSTTTITSHFAYQDVSDVPGQQNGVDIEVTNYQDTSEVPSPLVTIDPENETYPWNASPITHTFDVTAPSFNPALPFLSVPIYSSVLFTGTSSTYSNAALTNLILLHPNSEPTLSNPSPGNYSATIDSGSIDFPVSIDHDDANGDTSTLTFELSNDNFATIAQSAEYENVAAGATQEHTFTDLGVGTYRWRVLAEQSASDLPEECEGAAYLDPLINLEGASVLSASTDIELIGDEETLAPSGTAMMPVVLTSIVGLVSSAVLYFRRLRR